MINRIAIIVSLILLFVTMALSTNVTPYNYEFEIDAVSGVEYVIDGDTFDTHIGRIRLADINAPELNEPGGYEAKIVLTYLIQGKIVYIDIDDIYVTDKYGRIVAIVYIRFNSTHLLNVNKWLVDKGYAEITDYPNQFDPYTWTLYVCYPYEETPPIDQAIPPNIMINSIDINLTRIDEIGLGNYWNLYYLQPYVYNDTIRILALQRYNSSHDMILVYSSNGSTIFNSFIPHVLPSYMFRSFDLSKLATIRRHGYPNTNTTIYLVSLDKLQIKKIELPMDISKIIVYNDLIELKVPFQNKIMIINISTLESKVYTLNITNLENLLLVAYNKALITKPHKFLIYDLFSNRTIKEFYCESSSLINIDNRSCLIKCVSWSNQYTYFDYIILDPRTTSYNIISSWDEDFDFIKIFDANNIVFILGFTGWLSLGRGGPVIYVFNNSTDYSWYRSIYLEKYSVIQDPGKASFFNGYISLIINGEECSQYSNLDDLSSNISLLVVDPSSENYDILHISSGNGCINYGLAYVVNDYLFIPIVKDGNTYLEIFKIHLTSMKNTVYVLNISYINTIATLTTYETITQTITNYRTVTTTETETITEPEVLFETITKTRQTTLTISVTKEETKTKTIIKTVPYITSITLTRTTMQRTMELLILLIITSLLSLITFLIIRNLNY
ncbi:MAG: hypothetical protein DRO40_08395 [Thermoprotei archaeon]|nr:MAG: hypothetical protein DRO40_08395 [Thermoprotei archaeon]